MRESPKSQARIYLKAARWGFDNLRERRPSGYEFRFHLIGILAALRAIQHVLDKYDRKQSPEHAQVIGEWWDSTDVNAIPELSFIKRWRDLILKEGDLNVYAGRGEAVYEVFYPDEGGETHDHETHNPVHDLIADIENALAWCERQLMNIEAQLPARCTNLE